VPDRLRSSQESSTLEAADLLAVAGAGRSAPMFYWEKPSERLAMLGLGVAWEMRASGSGRFTEASHAFFNETNGPPRFNPMAAEQAWLRVNEWFADDDD